MENEDNNKAEVAVSVLIPVYNEEESLHELRDELIPVLESLGEPFEVLFVDDGSTDRSPAILREFHENDPRLRVIRFARNFGQQMANTAGLRFARGRAVIIMDADLQTPAHYIPAFLSKLREGYDIVYGKRRKIRAPLYRRIGTVVANYLICKMTGFEIPDSASGFLALDEKLVRNVNRYNERSRYLSGLFAWLAYGRYAVIPVDRRTRAHGESRYRIWQLMRIVLNLLTTFSNRPLQLASCAGMGVSVLTGLVGVRWLYLLVREGWRAAEPALFVALLLGVAAMQLLALGVLGEYVGRIYGEVREQPPYVIAEVLDNGQKTPSDQS